MTKDEHEKLLKDIAASQDSETTLNLLQTLRTDFDTTAQTIASMTSQADVKAKEWKDKYEKTRQDYIDRFFANPADIEPKPKEDTKTDTKTHSFEQLFKNKGDK
jgi:hypothetical protein